MCVLALRICSFTAWCKGPIFASTKCLCIMLHQCTLSCSTAAPLSLRAANGIESGKVASSHLGSAPLPAYWRNCFPVAPAAANACHSAMADHSKSSWPSLLECTSNPVPFAAASRCVGSSLKAPLAASRLALVACHPMQKLRSSGTVTAFSGVDCSFATTLKRGMDLSRRLVSTSCGRALSFSLSPKCGAKGTLVSASKDASSGLADLDMTAKSSMLRAPCLQV